VRWLAALTVIPGIRVLGIKAHLGRVVLPRLSQRHHD